MLSVFFIHRHRCLNKMYIFVQGIKFSIPRSIFATCRGIFVLRTTAVSWFICSLFATSSTNDGSSTSKMYFPLQIEWCERNYPKALICDGVKNNETWFWLSCLRGLLRYMKRKAKRWREFQCQQNTYRMVYKIRASLCDDEKNKSTVTSFIDYLLVYTIAKLDAQNVFAPIVRFNYRSFFLRRGFVRSALKPITFLTSLASNQSI